MLTFGILLCYLLGLTLLLAISRKQSIAEILGYSFLIGMGVETVFLFVLDLVHVRYSTTTLTIVNAVVIVAVNAANYKNLIALKNEFNLPSFELKQINFAALFLLCIIAYLLYAITVKNLFWPTAEHDSIASFDKLGKVMAIEGKLKISLFQYDLEGSGGIYPPLFQGSLAYVYIFGADISKIVTTLFFVSMLCTFYSLLRNYIDATASMLFTLIFMITPELFAHAALSLDNLPTTAYVGTGALATFTWLDKHDRKYLWLAAIMTGFGIWTRSDTLPFTVAALLVISIDLLRRKEFKSSIIYSVFAIAPFVIWTLYLKFKIAKTQAARFDFGVGYNAERLHLLTSYLKAFLFGGQYSRIDGGQLYGIVFVFFFLLIIVNLAVMYKVGVKKILADKMYVLIFFFTSLALYFTIFYLINEKAQGAPLSSLMESSFKRGLFCFLPVALFYVATNYSSAWLFQKIEKFRNPV